MAARRCEDCDRNYPTDTSRCILCGGALIFSNARDPDDVDCGGLATTAEKVEAWRLHVLIEAGYTVSVAERLAVEPWHRVDLHAAVELLERGCPPKLALEILL